LLRNGKLSRQGFEDDIVVPRVVTGPAVTLGLHSQGTHFFLPIALTGQALVHLYSNQPARPGDFLIIGCSLPSMFFCWFSYEFRGEPKFHPPTYEFRKKVQRGAGGPSSFAPAAMGACREGARHLHSTLFHSERWIYLGSGPSLLQRECLPRRGPSG